MAKLLPKVIKIDNKEERQGNGKTGEKRFSKGQLKERERTNKS